MNDLSFSSQRDLDIFFKAEKFKKVLIICGETSYKSSGANKILDKF